MFSYFENRNTNKKPFSFMFYENQNVISNLVFQFFNLSKNPWH